MLIIWPFRATNPPERFPFCTLGLIIVNTLVFAFTSQHFLVLQQQYVEAHAVSHSPLTFPGMFSSLFLQESLDRLLLVNLFLWVFGASVEDRLRPFKFLILYFSAGLIGNTLLDLVLGVVNPDMPALGAAGAVMGLAGAYLFIYPEGTIDLFGLVSDEAPWLGVTEWHPRWVVLSFLIMDVGLGAIWHQVAGTSYFLHATGFLAGLLLTILFRPERDEAEYEDTESAGFQDSYARMSYSELEDLMQRPTENMNLVQAYCEKAVVEPGLLGEQRCFATLQRYMRPLIERGDPRRLAGVILRLDPPFAQRVPTDSLIRLGAHLERAGDPDSATKIYSRAREINPRSRDAEEALVRLARVMDKIYHNYEAARRYYSELLRAFPHGEYATDARAALREMNAEHH